MRKQNAYNINSGHGGGENDKLFVCLLYYNKIPWQLLGITFVLGTNFVEYYYFI